jgi:uncharacterized membrane protein YqjE
MPNHPPSLSDAIRSLSASVVALGRTRLELFGIELSEQKENAVRIGVLAAIGLLCLAMAAAVFTAFIAVLFWETDYRELAVGLLAAAWLLAGVLCLLTVSRRLKDAKHPFSLTLAELERDLDVLTSPLADPDSTVLQRHRVRTSTATTTTGASGTYNPTDPGNPT